MKNLLVSDDVSGVETTPLLKKRNSDNNNNNGSFFSRNISKNRNGILILSCVAFLLLGISSTAINSSSFGFGKFMALIDLGAAMMDLLRYQQHVVQWKSFLLTQETGIMSVQN